MKYLKKTEMLINSLIVDKKPKNGQKNTLK
ncbi:MAG: hypothetical protein H6Q25_432 [Bacteroidetes bacterium]|jgi:hypothetical protein|nr:hypothetical protein [Bacteroidota bacterium]